jgi:hypothetical protein
MAKLNIGASTVTESRSAIESTPIFFGWDLQLADLGPALLRHVSSCFYFGTAQLILILSRINRQIKGGDDVSRRWVRRTLDLTIQPLISKIRWNLPLFRVERESNLEWIELSVLILPSLCPQRASLIVILTPDVAITVLYFCADCPRRCTYQQHEYVYYLNIKCFRFVKLFRSSGDILFWDHCITLGQEEVFDTYFLSRQ